MLPVFKSLPSLTLLKSFIIGICLIVFPSQKLSSINSSPSNLSSKSKYELWFNNSFIYLYASAF